MIRYPLLAVLWLAATVAQAADVYKQPEDFVREAFSGNAPEPSAVWLIGELGERAESILGHEPGQLRQRFWRRGTRSAWILEEIGKERPITVGWVVEDGRIEATEVLIYRESRGWEVRHPFFRKQLRSAHLEGDDQLSRQVDNISGATLSVRAMRRMARLALALHDHVTNHGEE